MDQKRLTILMIEIEQPEGLTARKLVAETMKHNVITAYTAQEGLDLFARNSIDVVLVHTRVAGMPAADVIRSIRTSNKPDVSVLLVLATDHSAVQAADYGANATVRPHHVEDLVDFLNKLSFDLLHQQPAEHPVTQTTAR